MGGVTVHVEVGSPGVDGDALDSVTHALFRSEARELGCGEDAGHPLDGVRVNVAVKRNNKRHAVLTVLILLGFPFSFPKGVGSCRVRSSAE